MARHRDQLWYADADNILELDGLRDYAGTYQNAATVACSGIVKVSDGSSLSGAFPYTMTYQAGSDGRYIGVIPVAVGVAAGETYQATITVNSGGLVDQRVIVIRVETRSIT